MNASCRTTALYMAVVVQFLSVHMAVVMQFLSVHIFIVVRNIRRFQFMRAIL